MGEIVRAVALSDDFVIQAYAFSNKVLSGSTGRMLAPAQDPSKPGEANPLALPTTGTLAECLEPIEAMVLRECLLRHQWNKTRAAQELGLSRVGLRAKLGEIGVVVSFGDVP